MQKKSNTTKWRSFPAHIYRERNYRVPHLVPTSYHREKNRHLSKAFVSPSTHAHASKRASLQAGRDAPMRDGAFPVRGGKRAALGMARAERWRRGRRSIVTGVGRARGAGLGLKGEVYICIYVGGFGRGLDGRGREDGTSWGFVYMYWYIHVYEVNMSVLRR